MDDLTYDLLNLGRRNPDGGKTSQADRRKMLKLFSRQLREGGFLHMRARSLKMKHVRYLVARWLGEGIKTDTIKNRLSFLRWWAEKVDKRGLISNDNAELGVGRREYANTPNRAKTLTVGQLEKVSDGYVRMSLMLQQAFGLRREEAIKFQPDYADQGDHIRLKDTWCKGKRPRTIPIRNEEQRRVLDAAHRLTGKGSLIPADQQYKHQLRKYEGQCKQARLSNMHGLRHGYGQVRYEELTGWKAPKAGGPGIDELTSEQRIKDRMARQIISRELGHERLEVTNVYLGGRRMG